MKTRVSHARRQFLACVLACACITANAEPIDRELLGEAAHKVVYQLNQADAAYIGYILHSAGELLRRHGDNIHIVITLIGPGVHLVVKNPARPIAAEARSRAASLAAYGVEFHVCNNTLKALDLSAADVLDYATVVDIGAEDLMRLQEQGYAYISW